MPVITTPQEAMSMVQMMKLDPAILDKAKDDNGVWNMDLLNELVENVKTQSDFTSSIAPVTKQVGEGLEEVAEGFEQVQNIPVPTMAGVKKPIEKAAKMKTFNLKKAQIDMSGMAESPADFGAEQMEMQGDQMEEMNSLNEPGSPFKTHIELDAKLKSIAAENGGGDGMAPQTKASQMLSQYAPGKMDSVEGLLEHYYAETNPERQVDIADQIHGLIWGKGGENGGMEMQVPYSKANALAKIVEASADHIKELAYSMVKKEASKSFNLKKQAQHGTVNNIVQYGPYQMRPDPFLRGQPVSDWHIVERNKGFGQDIDGIWNIDWEAFWRGNIMDKYSRPYRDTETGEWIGGYLNKRFETDKNVPEQNNMQLLPGELRKPRLPQYGSLETRMQHMRSQDKRGYGPDTNTSKPFNWNEANAKGSVKTAAAKKKTDQVTKSAQRPREDPFEYKSVFDKNAPDPRKAEAICPHCQSELAQGSTFCPNCKKQVSNTETGQLTNYTPDQTKIDNKPIGVLLSSAIDEIVYDSSVGKFVTKIANNEDESQPEEYQRRMHSQPGIKPVTKKERLWKSREFKPEMMPPESTKSNPSDDKYRKKIDVTKSCKDLAIDG